ncbi:MULTISPECIES: aminotransferase class IV [unclassified Nocardioides]|uniref:aminotransferase class IV n=1 Tax=unclassified Nocardioides TaxID=2615069 RepID=UPI001885E857|nr:MULTISPECIES: aminotransferase class IV [unclassified Nocardioides]
MDTSRGLAVGEGVFTSVLVERGRVFALDRHLDRLLASVTALGLPRLPRDDVRRAVADAVRTHPVARGRLRIVWVAGPEGGELLVELDPVPPAADAVEVVTLPYVVDHRGVLAGHKTTAYADNVVALAAARAAGAGEGMLANADGDLCEATAANVFLVLNGELVTPTLGSGCLPGVTRALVVEACGAREVDVPLEEAAARAEEVFLTSTTRGVQPVSAWDGRDLPTAGPVLREVRQHWSLAARDLWWTPGM